jgi:RNA polymerase-binding transcription factor DksA
LKRARERELKAAAVDRAREKAAREKAREKAAMDRAREKAAREKAREKAAMDRAREKAAREKAREKAAMERAREKARAERLKANEKAKALRAQELAAQRAVREQEREAQRAAALQLKLELAEQKKRELAEAEALRAAMRIRVAREERDAARAKEREKAVLPEPGEAVRVDNYVVRPTIDFDVEYLTVQLGLLLGRRSRALGQVSRLEKENTELLEGMDRDTRFDEEGGDGDAAGVERDRNIAISMQSTEEIQRIDDAILRMANGLYGYSVISNKAIPRERLEAIPWATELTAERAGSIVGW